MPVTNSEAYRPEFQVHKGRRESKKLKLPVDIRRASSSPHIVGIIQGMDNASSPGSDKRRNKLGYQRTTIACGKQLLGITNTYHILMLHRSL